MSFFEPSNISFAGTRARPPFRAVVVAPTYNNARTLPDVLRRIEAVGLPLIVVDDGSTDQTPEVLSAWQQAGVHGRHVVRHGANRGKAAALRTGFESAVAAGFSHAVTIDTDGQLSPEDIPKLLELSTNRPDALVVGARDENAFDYPNRSRIGRRISNFLVWAESGLSIADSQCGLRVYPLQLASNIRCAAEHFGFETEIITRAAWAGVPVIGGPVSCRYLPPGERVSHFKPWLDTVRSARMHCRLIAGALNPFRRRNGHIPGSTKRERDLKAGETDDVRTGYSLAAPPAAGGWVTKSPGPVE